ncbi:hypothetical protein AB0K43_21915 [Kitasatospora sp. NPDC049258]|uniref:hypothetical protein n=1 Tax=Kitasatospora sp. NPDC049258 TaxID=3155394 RepID=UPI0034232769
MNVSVISLFAKFATAGAGRSWTSRLAVSVPLAAVVAVGAVGCSDPKTGTAAGRPSAAASTAVTAPAPATASAAPSTAAPTAAPAVPAADTGAAETTEQGSHPAAPAARRTADQEVTVRFDGLDEGRKLAAGGDPTVFSVTWTNTSGHRLAGVAPVVAAQQFTGARCQVIMGTVAGTLERNDGGAWTDVPISQGTGMDYATTGNKAAFPLAAGASRTIQYRIRLAEDNGPAPLAIEADAYVPSTTDFKALGKAVRRIAVVDEHRPSAGMPTMTPIPTSVTVGGPAVEVQVSAGNFTAAPFRSLAPRLTLGVTRKTAYVDEALGAENVGAEVFVAGAWKKLPVTDDCGEVSVDTSSLAAPLENGPNGRVLNHLFRFSLAPSVAADVTSLDVSAGAVADGHYAESVTTRVGVKR